MIDVNGPKMFACDECPIEFPEYGDFQFDHCGCDKTGDEFFSCGYCEDAWVDRPEKKQKSRQGRGRAYRRKMEMKNRKRLLDLAKSSYCDILSISIEWSFVNGELLPTGRYAKFPKNSKSKRYWKNYSNRVIRRGSCFGSGKGGYKRGFDYWWQIC